MKTSVNMVRKLDVFDVIQRTKDGMFNATALLNQWNVATGEQKRLQHYLENDSTKEFIKALIEDDLKDRKSGYDDNRKSGYDDNRKSHLITSRANKGVNAGTWMSPLLFIDFAMWLNPAFKVKVLKFVYDNLIAFRHSCGDNYRTLTDVVCRFPDVDYPLLGRVLNYVIFGKHYPGIRNDATEEELSNLKSLEEKYVFALDKGYIPTFKALISSLRKDWETKWRNNK